MVTPRKCSYEDISTGYQIDACKIRGSFASSEQVVAKLWLKVWMIHLIGIMLLWKQRVILTSNSCLHNKSLWWITYAMRILNIQSANADLFGELSWMVLHLACYFKWRVSSGLHSSVVPSYILTVRRGIGLMSLNPRLPFDSIDDQSKWPRILKLIFSVVNSIRYITSRLLFAEPTYLSCMRCFV